MPLPPVAVGFLAEFFRSVFAELGAALRRRRAARKLAREREREKRELEKLAEEQRVVYIECLKDLKKKSKIPENPYGK